MRRWQMRHMSQQPQSPAASPHPRKEALDILARASSDELSVALGAHVDKARDLKPAEIGLVMLRGRMGGDGAAFNMGEATVVRAVVEMPGGVRGFGHALGRDRRKARLIAIADALWQSDETRAMIEAGIIAPVRLRLSTERQRRASEAAATKVDFFTVARGEDAA
jgi:alpha-D-ribose 1-methylphosphonate 5-triphosphate synthase subunit PhnG